MTCIGDVLSGTDRLERLGGVLDDLETAPGDRIAVLSANSVPYLELHLGIPAHGRVIVPLNTRWAIPELHYALTDAHVSALFTDQDLGGSLGGALGVPVVSTDSIEYEYRLAHADPVPFRTNLGSGALAGIFYTGGTTDAAKGVMLTHGNLVANADAMRTIAPLDPADTFLVMAPLFHAAGSTSVLYTAMAGASQVTVPFDPPRVLDTIAQERITHTLAVPTMIAALLDEQDARPRDLSSLRVLMHGAAPITANLVRRIVDALPGVERIHLYGTTETSPIISAQRHAGSDPQSVGYPVRCEVAIRDDVGEIYVHGPNVMAGYWNKPDATAAAFDDRWYRTGDIGTFDRDGHLLILDRKNDVIITGGENVYPSEVERILCAHPAVVEAAVFGRHDERWGEAICAAVVVRSPVEEQRLIDHCRLHIARYKAPRRITFVDELPKSAAGKVLRRELR